MKGWYNEQYRHSLAAKGIKTSFSRKNNFQFIIIPSEDRDDKKLEFEKKRWEEMKRMAEEEAERTRGMMEEQANIAASRAESEFIRRQAEEFGASGVKPSMFEGVFRDIFRKPEEYDVIQVPIIPEESERKAYADFLATIRRQKRESAPWRSSERGVLEVELPEKKEKTESGILTLIEQPEIETSIKMPQGVKTHVEHPQFREEAALPRKAEWGMEISMPVSKFTEKKAREFVPGMSKKDYDWLVGETKKEKVFKRR